MPIDSNFNPSSGSYNYENRYSDKHQNIAPESRSTQGSWLQTSSRADTSHSLVDKKPYSALSSSQQKQLDQARTTKDKLEKLPVDFPINAMPKTAYEAPITLLEQRIKKLEVSPQSKNPLQKLSDYRENKKADKAFNKEMGGLYKQARDVQSNGTNPTERNRASNLTDELTTMGRDQPWFKAISAENRKEKGVNFRSQGGNTTGFKI
ncbi:hypothetical protein [Pseudomonas sp. NIBRBAC000502773]|jgi:hypothetical protein|uniref:hypothetical protein n=1 Tax=Pseudomonas sp. NIBRBAC000502773 TaxID=2590776 RepID=UPI00112FE72F|nr:hypothetical protein [Pseudomonas sp. NIBRBAC000502773]QDG56338.1 hypothetical protein NIBR502773_07350 [Pseudomonas sp. NIBRBAC000502773]